MRKYYIGALLVLLTGCKNDQDLGECGCDVFGKLYSSFKLGRVAETALGREVVNCEIRCGGKLYSVSYLTYPMDDSVVSLWSQNGIVKSIQFASMCKESNFPIRFVEEFPNGGLQYSEPECFIESGGCDIIRSECVDSVLCRLKEIKDTLQVERLFGSPNCIIGRKCSSSLDRLRENHPIQYCYYFKPIVNSTIPHSMMLVTYSPFGWLLKISRDE